MPLPQPSAGSAWTNETLRQHFLELMGSLGTRINEVDLRNQQRFDAQELALNAAMTAAQRAIEQALIHTQQHIELNDRRYQERVDAIDKAREYLLATLRATEQRIDSQFQMLTEHGNDSDEVKELATRALIAIEALDRLTDAKFVTLRTLVDSQAEKVALALTASDKAVTKAELASDKRFEGVNEFREQLREQAGSLMPRTEAEQRIAANALLIDNVSKRFDALTARVDRTEGRSTGHVDTSRNLATVVGLVIAAIAIIVTIYLSVHR